MPRYVDEWTRCSPPESSKNGDAAKNEDPYRFVVPGWLPFLLLALTVSIGLLQAWFAHERREIAYELRALDEEMTQIQNEIDAVHIDAERLRSPARVAELARALGFVRPEARPTVLPPRPTLAVTPIDATERERKGTPSKAPALLSAGGFRWFKRPSAKHETDSR